MNSPWQPISGSSPAREYLIDQLRITATHLAETHIFRKHPGLPFCQVCHMSGINDRPFVHLPSCAVGRVLSAIEQLKGAPPLPQWNGWDVEHVRRLPGDRAIVELKDPAETYRIELDPVEHPTAVELA